jgi:hypothetical protein
VVGDPDLVFAIDVDRDVYLVARGVKPEARVFEVAIGVVKARLRRRFHARHACFAIGFGHGLSRHLVDEFLDILLVASSELGPRSRRRLHLTLPQAKTAAEEEISDRMLVHGSLFLLIIELLNSFFI